MAASATLASALLLGGCGGKPRCSGSSRYSFSGGLAPAATVLENGTICGMYGALGDQHASVYLWGDSADRRRLMLETRVKMRAQGWAEYTPSGPYVHVPENKLFFQQGMQSLSYQFDETTWRFFGPRERAAIRVTVTSSTLQPRPSRWR